VVKEDGTVSYYSQNSLGRKGSQGGPPLSAEILGQLRVRLKSLPSSTSKPPPNERKLVLHRFEDDTAQAFCYDLANPPEVALEIMRLAASHLSTWTLAIKPDGEWPAHRSGEGSMALLARTNQLVTWANYEPLRIWDCATHQQVREIAFPNSQPHLAGDLSVSPDERYIALADSNCIVMDTSVWREAGRIQEIPMGSVTYGFCSPIFTPDGSNLFLHTSAPVTGFYKVATWLPATVPQGLPPDLVKFAPLGTNGRFMTLTKDGRLAMTDPAGPAITIREQGVRDFCCAMLPSLGHTVVAIGTPNQHGRSDYRILILETYSGKTIRELRPFEQNHDDATVLGLFWGPDSTYVMAALGSGDIAIWNTVSGRHRGTLERSHSGPNSVVSSSDGTTLYQFRRDGVIQYWRLEAALNKVRDFENALASEEPTSETKEK